MRFQPRVFDHFRSPAITNPLYAALNNNATEAATRIRNADYGESIPVCILISLAGSWPRKKWNRLVALSPPANRNSPLFSPLSCRPRFRNKRKVLSLELAREFLVGCVLFEARSSVGYHIYTVSFSVICFFFYLFLSLPLSTFKRMKTGRGEKLEDEWTTNLLSRVDLGVFGVLCNENYSPLEIER